MMATPYHHSISSVKQFGGEVDDYIDIHHWFDESKAHHGDFRHRALRHHTQGIFECEKVFGKTITNSKGRVVPTRLIGEQHVREDMGYIPSVSDWLKHLQPQPWMNKPLKAPHEDKQPPTKEPQPQWIRPQPKERNDE